jgi:hypothetical protein
LEVPIPELKKTPNLPGLGDLCNAFRGLRMAFL